MHNHENRHELEIIQKGDWGRVQRCRSCRFIQIEYGNFIRSFNEMEFIELMQITSLHLAELVTLSPHNHQRPIVFRFPDIDGYYCFNELEWIQFNQVLEQTKETIEVDIFLQKNGFLTQ